ncbi:MAG: hypothetical protein H7Y38_16030 [Armatimonadetes bacterium]|nr:hypothetical protein [Armatimonadota bacterium]
MAMRRRGKHFYADSTEDTPEVIRRYSKSNGYEATLFAVPVCSCGGRTFRLRLDEDAGVAVRTCANCESVHTMGDGDEYIADANLQECACLCGGEIFGLTVGVALYADSADVRWLYVGCHCPVCRLTAVYGDWKNEFIGYSALLARV